MLTRVGYCPKATAVVGSCTGFLCPTREVVRLSGLLRSSRQEILVAGGASVSVDRVTQPLGVAKYFTFLWAGHHRGHGPDKNGRIYRLSVAVDLVPYTSGAIGGEPRTKCRRTEG